MKEKHEAKCAKCAVAVQQRACLVPSGKGPSFCPTINYKDLTQEAFDTTDKEECALCHEAICQEAAGYVGKEDGYAMLRPNKPRIVELIEFCHRMKYSRIGLIFCMGARSEASIVHDIFTVNGLEVVSVTCKVGQIAKTRYDIGPEHLLNKDLPEESACNPKVQALLVNQAKADFAVLLNLCVGHDSIAIKHLDMPVSVLSVKDRLLGHNPLLAIYQYDTYYRYLKQPLPRT